MTRRTKVLTRLVAGAGALALASAGLLASTGTAHAEVLDETVDPTKTGSLTINKWEDGGHETKPLKGVEFTVCEFLYDGESIDLTNDAGWDLVAEINDAVSDGTALPNDVTKSEDCLVQSTNDDGYTTFAPLTVGAYHVSETATGGNLIETPMPPFAVTIPMPVEGGFNYNVIADPKNVLGEVPVTKTLQDLEPGAELVPGTTEVNWTIAATIPASTLNYESLAITDQLPAGLEFVSWGDITVGTQPLIPGTDYTISTTGTAPDLVQTITLDAPGLAKVNAGKTAAQDLTAVIRTKVLTVGVHSNNAKVILNGQPGEDDDQGNWGAAKLKKVSEVGQAELEGAVFKLYRANAAGQCELDDDLLIGSDETDENGLADWAFFIGYNDAVTLTVCLWEETAPAGHVLPADRWVGGPSEVTANAEGTPFDFGTITNHKPEGPKLPETGAQGTWAMTVGGFLLIAGAATTLIVRRRKATH